MIISRQSGEKDTGLRRRIFNRLAVKVFLISFIVQVLSGLLICYVLYSQTPEMLYSPKDELDDLMEELRDVTKARGAYLIDDYIRRTGMDLAIFDQSDFVTEGINDPLDDIGTLTIKSIDDYELALQRSYDTESMMGTFGLYFKAIK